MGFYSVGLCNANTRHMLFVEATANTIEVFVNEIYDIGTAMCDGKKTAQWICACILGGSLHKRM